MGSAAAVVVAFVPLGAESVNRLFINGECGDSVTDVHVEAVRMDQSRRFFMETC